MNEVINLISLFFAGLLSYLSPCVLGIVPLYLSYMAGTQSKLENKNRLLKNTLLLIISFSLFFMLLGASASQIGNFFFEQKQIMATIFGIMFILFGLLITDLIKIPFLKRQVNLSVKITDSPLTAIMLGIAFAFTMLPCSGPFLASALTLAAKSQTLYKGLLYLFVYAMGIGVPLLLSALFFEKLFPMLRKNMGLINKLTLIAGAIMIIFGIIVLINGNISVPFLQF
jgi:cytochrome c-type biogenesis protein